jgi:hypothetical protein
MARALVALAAAAAMFAGPNALGALPGFQLAGLALYQETGRDIYLGGIYLTAPTHAPTDRLPGNKWPPGHGVPGGGPAHQYAQPAGGYAAAE